MVGELWEGDSVSAIEYERANVAISVSSDLSSVLSGSFGRPILSRKNASRRLRVVVGSPTAKSND